MDNKNYDKFDLGSVLLALHSYPEISEHIKNFINAEANINDVVNAINSEFSDEVVIGFSECVHFWREKLSKNRSQTIDEIKLEYNEMMADKYFFMSGKKESVPELVIVKAIEASVENNPEAVALIDEFESVTYETFWKRVNSVADFLMKLGVKIDDVVALEVENSIETVVRMTAIMLIGATYMPYDRKIPDDRKNYMIKNVNAKLIYGHTNTEMDGIVTVCYVSESDFEKRLPILQTDKSYCYAAFTSGTTGKPKGVRVGEYQLRNLLNWYGKIMRIKNDTRFIALHSFAFDTNFKNVFTPLINGGTSVINLDNEYDFRRISRYIGKNHCTHMKCNASIFEAVLLEEKENQYDNLRNLKHLFLGGDKFTGENLLDFYKKHEGKLQIINAYGPTEATDTSSYYNVTEEDLENLKAKDVPIGIPLYNQKIVVMSSNGYICSPGIKGEIFIGGIGVTEGYINLEEKQNKEVFKKDYVLLGETFYKSGDYGCWNRDNQLMFLGRNDDMVKIHGYRIFLSEIDNAVMHEEIITHSKTVVDGDNIAVFYRTKDNQEIQEDKLKQLCEKHLATYMIPKKYVHLEEFPYTSNGKIDKKSLLEMLNKNTDEKINVKYNDIQRKIADIWCSILKKDNIGINENFFDLGGNSLNLFMLSKKIEKETGVKIRPLEFIEVSTIEKIAELASERLK